MQLERVIAALAPADVLRRAPVEIGDLAYDARAVGPGSLFFCVPGSRTDGHDFAPQAVESGAVALVVERPLDLEVPQLVARWSPPPPRAGTTAPRKPWKGVRGRSSSSVRSPSTSLSSSRDAPRRRRVLRPP